MQSIFHYDSKFMQVLLKFADYILLNMLYMACCIPIITIGAAQAGLYNGLRVLQDPEDDSSSIKAFFRGFANGFWTITILWTITSIIIALLGYNVLALYVYNDADYIGSTVPYIMSIAAVVICIIYQSMMSIFHSRFSCTIPQLIKNTFYIIMANPFHSIAVTILLWAPVFSIAVFPLFQGLFLILIFLYYSTMLGFSVKIMAKPFKRLADNFKSESEQP